MVWGTTVPTAMGYAQVAGLPVQMGLYASIAALTCYAIFGTSSLLKVETSPSMSIMSAVIITLLARGDVNYYISLSAALAVIIGIMLIIAAIARMGFLSDFMAKPVIVGFLFGLALIVIIQQIPKLFGVESQFGTGLMQAWDFLLSLSEINWITLAISVVSFAILILMRRFFPRFPAALLVIGISVLAVSIFNLTQYGVALVGYIPGGLPSFQIPAIRPGDIIYLSLGGIAMLFVTLGESLGTARTFASGRRNRIDANQELLALGAANLGAGLFQGFAVGGNPSTTSSSNAARSKTQLASLFTAAILILTIILRVDLIGRTPQAVVSVVVIISISHLMQSGIMRRFYHTRKTDFILAMIALLGVLVLGIFPGLVISVLLSLLAVLYHSSQPRISVLGKLPHHEGYADIEENPEIILYPGILILRPNVPLFFANANLVQANIINLVHGTPQPTRSIILDLSASNDLDIAVTDMLSGLIKDLSQDDMQVMIADAGSSTIIQLKNAKVINLLPTGKVYRNIQEAIDAALNPIQAQD